MQNELIIVSEYCRKCHIEPSFIDLLQEGGLIEVMTEGGERYLTFTQLPDVERYSRMYYDLSINIEGIDAIHHLLQRMEEMQNELHELRSQLRLFGKGAIYDKEGCPIRLRQPSLNIVNRLITYGSYPVLQL